MKYVLWIGMAFALLILLTGTDRVWPALLLGGMAANGLVMGANGWKMPVRGRCVEGVRHTLMTPATHLPWLADIIPTGLGIASIGDFLIMAGILGMWANRHSAPYVQTLALLTFGVWVIGWTKGFDLLGKWPQEERRDARKNLPIILMLILLGNLLHVRGCSTGELSASVNGTVEALHSALETQPKKINADAKKWRDLGVVHLTPPPFKVLTRLKMESGKREQEREKLEQIRTQSLARDAVLQAVNIVRFSPQSEIHERTRKGPFCHVSCFVHHGDVYDRETLPELCNANWIPPETMDVPGWWPLNDTKEITTAWPGPAVHGFHSYKLYWKEK